MKRFLILIQLLAPAGLFAQLSKQDSIWKPMSFFAGKWNGTGEGEPGKGNYVRTYQFIFNNRFIEISNKSTYPAADNTPNGEIHEDKGFISYDNSRNIFVLRQFHIEGFVNQYRLESISPDGQKIVFISEAIENIPAGWRAKETLQLISNNSFTEIFELAPPNGEFQVYTKAVFTRGPVMPQ